MAKNRKNDSPKPKTIRPGTVEKIIKSPFPQRAGKSGNRGGRRGPSVPRDPDRKHTGRSKGNKVKLKTGAHVDVTVEADLKDTVPMAFERVGTNPSRPPDC